MSIQVSILNAPGDGHTGGVQNQGINLLRSVNVFPSDADSPHR